MNYFFAALRCELLKTRKAKIFWLVALIFTILPLVCGVFMYVLKNPDLGADFGLLGAKAQFVSEASWPAYFNLQAQMISVGGIIAFGFTTSWIFGREYADSTLKDLLALPYPRGVIVAGKFLTSFIANIFLSLYIIAVGIFLGFLIGLSKSQFTVFWPELLRLILTTLMIVISIAPVAFVASCGKGYLAPLGFVILILVLSQIVTIAGFGEFFPWSIPALYSGMGQDASFLKPISFIIVTITGLIGVLSTLYFWTYTDQY